MKEYKENLEKDGVVVNTPSPTPDASWIDDAAEIIHNKPRESKSDDD